MFANDGGGGDDYNNDDDDNDAVGSKARPGAVSVRSSDGIFLRRSDVPGHTSRVGVHIRSVFPSRVLDVDRVLQVSVWTVWSPCRRCLSEQEQRA